MLHLWLHRDTKLPLESLLQPACRGAQMQTCSWVVSFPWDQWPSSLPFFMVGCTLFRFPGCEPSSHPFNTWFHVHSSSSYTACSPLKTFSCSLGDTCPLIKGLHDHSRGLVFTMHILTFGFFFFACDIKVINKLYNCILLIAVNSLGKYLGHLQLEDVGHLPLFFALRTNTALRPSTLPSWGFHSDEEGPAKTTRDKYISKEFQKATSDAKLTLGRGIVTWWDELILLADVVREGLSQEVAY